MKKKSVKHFVPDKDREASPGKGNGGVGGVPAGNCFRRNLPAWMGFGEIAEARRGVTCGNCRRTRVFRKLK